MRVEKKIKISRGLTYFLISLLLSFLFFAGLNYFQGNLEDFFFWQETKNLPLTAQLNQEFFENFKPFRNWNIENPQIGAQAALSVFINADGQEKVLFEKNSRQRLPIASLTKLMTALIALENYDLSRVIEISEHLPENNGQLKRGEKFEVKDLLYFLLVNSDNGAARALADKMGIQSFVFLMNKKAKALGMENTYFVNPTGLDPDNPKELSNFSTVRDLVILGKAAFKRPIIAKILSTPEIEIYSREALISHKLKNTNELLTKMPDLLVGKTGWTPQAKGCLMVMTKAPQNKGRIVSVILGSDNRFEEMKALINWLDRAYIF